MLINHLIRIYFHVCDKYKEQLCWEVQRFSNNSHPADTITDEELMTIYLFCVAYEEKYKTKSMYHHIKNHWHSWFPLLPSYQAFNRRLNRLGDAFGALIMEFFNSLSMGEDRLKVLLGDSFPVITCSHKRKGKVARELTDKGFCATKKLHYYGVKVHMLGLQRRGTIPFPQYVEVTPASVHDLSALRGVLEKITADRCILDKAYTDSALAKEMLRSNNNLLLTPLKDKKGWEALFKQSEQAFSDLFNTAVATGRQPIESLFNRINELTYIQNASKVRSSNGLMLHLYGKLAAAIMLMANF
jgi:hypothetical protein